MPSKLSSITLSGSLVAPVTTAPRNSGLGVTSIVSLTPSRVSSAFGLQDEKYPVSNTRFTSSRTSSMV